jgi:hypothetical protein
MQPIGPQYNHPPQFHNEPIHSPNPTQREPHTHPGINIPGLQENEPLHGYGYNCGRDPSPIEPPATASAALPTVKH